MEWQTPQFLYLILPLCLSWLVLALYSEKRRQRAREAFISKAMQGRILPATSRFRFWCKLVLFEIALATGLMALAGPRFGTQVEQVVPRGSDLYVLIDVSRSMLADDVVPSRLERAKADVSSLVNRLNGERIGLIAFAGKAVVKCPLTVDYDSFRRALMELDPNSAPRGGTAIGDAIRKAVEVFHAGTQRDQAVLLITDGDDQESFPLEAATVAAERKVTVFTVGLGDSNSGARIPGAGSPGQSTNSSFMEHEGQQVWSKLNGALLSEIALKTNGVYIPAGTRSYDLGELYSRHLQGRTGDQSETQQRIRKSERFQIFLSLSLLALLIDLCFSRYSDIPVRQSTTLTATAPQAIRSSRSTGKTKNAGAKSLPDASHRSSLTLPLLAGISIGLMSEQINAGESHEQVREGLKHYQAAEYDSAEKLFASAAAELDKTRSLQAAVAAFDEACALHRKGDKEKARERYLKAGLSPDKTLATAAHFNLGTLSAENARSIAGDNPENVVKEDRQRILDELKQAVASYRHALEMNPDHQQSRRNLELVRTWIKYYSDRWNEIDRQKRRDESNLIQFLEFLMTTQTAMQDSLRKLPENVPLDVYAQFKKDQDKLAEELPFLREKIAAELLPQGSSPGAGPSPPSASPPSASPQSISPEVKAGIELLQSWSDKAADSMRSAARALLKAKAPDAVTHQQEAVTHLDQIWDAVIPFHPLLAKELSDQTTIAEQLAPLDIAPSSSPENSESAASPRPEGFVPISPAAESSEQTTETDKPADNTLTAHNGEDADKANNTDDGVNSSPSAGSAPFSPGAEFNDSELQHLLEQQSKTLRKARLLAPKAQAELSRLETNPAETVSAAPVPEVTPDGDPASAIPATQVDPEKIRQGLQKAVELSPKAVEAMELAVDHLQRKDPKSAAAPAEEARRILEEIQNAQPEEPQKDQDDKEQNKQDQDKQEQDDQQKENQKNDDNKKSQEQDQKKKQDSKQKQNEKDQGGDQQKKENDDRKKQSDQKKNDEQKRDQEKSGNKSDDSKNKSQSSDSNSEQPMVSRDRIEEALRKVRERQQEKRERDREMRARIIGRTPVEKDW